MTYSILFRKLEFLYMLLIRWPAAIEAAHSNFEEDGILRRRG